MDVRAQFKLSLIALVAALALGMMPARAATLPGRGAPAGGPAAYYLSLGDSLAFGYQPYPLLERGSGFSDDLAADLKRIRPGLRAVNLGCPAETSATFIKGGCPAAMFLGYKVPQLASALAFLKAHRGRVSPITYVLGGNDILPLLKGRDPARVRGVLQRFAANDDYILRCLRAAAPSADIVTIDYYQPFAAVVTDTVTLKGLIGVSRAENGIIDTVAARYHVKVANVYAAFNTPPRNPRLCKLTWICGPLHDVHPTTTGYRIMARLIEEALGYPGLRTDYPPPAAPRLDPP